ncbi:MAG: hypothetical protein U9N46_13680, partial [Euryarchaeota archaeon]|nr:hypothetical protein [Euryarchaeota archaeon]
TGASLSTLRLCDFATLRYIRGTQRRDDARAQRLETTESIRISLFSMIFGAVERTKPENEANVHSQS